MPRTLSLKRQWGRCSTSEIELARDLVQLLRPGMLALADREFYGFRLWEQAAATGADLLWRVKKNLRPRHVETLPDGSWLARIRRRTRANLCVVKRRVLKWAAKRAHHTSTPQPRAPAMHYVITALTER